MASVFLASMPWAKCDERVRRAIGQSNVEHPCIIRVLEACKRLKFKAESPGFLKDCWAHIAIPKEKIAIYVRDFLESTRIEKERLKWQAHGWRMLAVTHKNLDRLSDADLDKHLKEAVRWHGKVS